MISKAASQKEIMITSSEVENIEIKPEPSDTLSLKEISSTRGRSISRKPAQQSNLQSYKMLKRQSQESRDSHSHEKRHQQPPKYPKNVSQLNYQSKTTELPSAIEQDRPSQSVGSNVVKTTEGGKFKKKAMTRQEIIEVKHYMQRREESSDTNSMAGSEKAVPQPQSRDKQQYKKSKTQYFNLNQIHGRLQIGPDENFSESEKMLVVSLREKCKSVDETNLLLNKRVSWLREEIEVHLERQAQFQKTNSDLQVKVKTQANHIQSQEKEILQLKKQINSKEHEVEKLRKLVIDLNLKFENDREILNAEIEFLKSEQASEMEEREQIYQTNIQSLEEKIEKLTQKLQQLPLSKEQYQEQYSQSIIEKLVAENKYLKMENHMLARFKEKVEQLKRENKQICNERDTLKKKIIENLKKSYKSKDFDDSSELQSLLSLSISNVS